VRGIRAGLLRKRLLFQKPVRKPDEAGEGIAVWSDLFECWGSITPLYGDESEFAREMTGIITHKIKIRWTSELGSTAMCRVLWNGRIFETVTPMNTEERNREIQVFVKEVTDVR
jgi:SPP1 family predicted phage head-tail adaptor